MIRVIIICAGLLLAAATASAQAPAEKPPEKPAAAPAASGSTTTTVTPTPQRSKSQNSDATRDELTKKLECRKKALRDEQSKSRPQSSPPTK